MYMSLSMWADAIANGDKVFGQVKQTGRPQSIFFTFFSQSLQSMGIQIEEDAFDFSIVKPTEPSPDNPSKKKKKSSLSGKKRDRDASEASDKAEKPKKKSQKKKKRDEDDQQTGDDDHGVNEETDEGSAVPEDEECTKKKKTRSEYGVWIGNLSFITSQTQLKKHLRRCGKITRIKMPLSKTGQNRGFAYVDFETEQGMHKAVSMSEKELNGRALLIKTASDYDTTGRLPRPDKTKSESAQSKEEDEHAALVKARKFEEYMTQNANNAKLFIGNLPYETTRANMTEVFGAYGGVAEMRLGQFPDSGKCKGFCHLIYRDPQHAAQVVRDARDSAKQMKVLDQFVRVEFGAKADNGKKVLPKKQQQQRPILHPEQQYHDPLTVTPDGKPMAIPTEINNIHQRFSDE